jgi:hypothetical protein
MCLVASLGACAEDEAAETSDAGGGGDADVATVQTVLTPSFDLDRTDFYGMPWPSDYRVGDDGQPDLSDFPQASDLMIQIYLEMIHADVRGFSTMPVIYVQFDGEVRSRSLPEPAETLADDSPVQLLNVGDDCGARIPIEFRFEVEGDRWQSENLLAAAPLPGFVLDPATPYAFVVLTSLGNENDAETAVPADFEGLLSEEMADQELTRVYRPLRDCLDAANLRADEIAVATVFTTQDPVRETRLLRDMVSDPDRVDAPVVRDWQFEDDLSQTGRFSTWSGTYETPIFQEGVTPYAAVGGGIRFDDDGEPIIQRWETVPFTITFPEDAGRPLPVFVWEDGTGADQFSHITTSVTSAARREDFAVANFQPQFHSNRSGPTADEENHTFNYINPESGRSVFRQQVADTSYFIRVIREAIVDQEGIPELAVDTMVYGGQSQGGILGALLAGVEPEFQAYILNGVGAYLSITVVERKDPIDIAAQIQNLFDIPGTLDRFHPVVAMAQLGAEVVDPQNYARYWRGWEGHPGGTNVFLINGRRDHTTPERSINAMTISSGSAPIAEAGWEIDPFEVWDVEELSLPISGNTTSVSGRQLTIATELSGNTGHFTIYDREEVRDMAIQFLVTTLSGTPILE